MSSTTSILDPGLHIPPPPVARRPAPHPTRRATRRGAIEEAALTFTLGLAFAWVLVEVALWLGGG